MLNCLVEYENNSKYFPFLKKSSNKKKQFFFTLLGENSIFTIQQFLSELKNSTVENALSYAISVRLRPKLMTASGAIVALTPLAFGIGSGAQMHQPLAIAIIGGLIIALPLLLFVLPSLLALIWKKEDGFDKES